MDILVLAEEEATIYYISTISTTSATGSPAPAASPPAPIQKPSFSQPLPVSPLQTLHHEITSVFRDKVTHFGGSLASAPLVEAPVASPSLAAAPSVGAVQ